MALGSTVLLAFTGVVGFGWFIDILTLRAHSHRLKAKATVNKIEEKMTNIVNFVSKISLRLRLSLRFRSR